MISWDEFDACKTAAEIARLLEAHSVKGRKGHSANCPLAHATGYKVGETAAWCGTQYRALTDAERRFIKQFDNGRHPRLCEKRLDGNE